MKQKELNITIQQMKLLRDRIDSEMSISRALVFLYIGMNDGLNQSEVSRMAGLEKAAASRNVLDLSSFTSRRKEGPGLIEARRDDPHDRRANILYLTDKGREIYQEVLRGEAKR